MATFARVPVDEAPRPTKSNPQQEAEWALYEEYIQEIGPDEVGVLIPDEGEHLMSVRLKLAKAAKRLKIEKGDLQVWTINRPDDRKVLFEKTKGPTSLRKRA